MAAVAWDDGTQPNPESSQTNYPRAITLTFKYVITLTLKPKLQLRKFDVKLGPTLAELEIVFAGLRKAIHFKFAIFWPFNEF